MRRGTSLKEVLRLAVERELGMAQAPAKPYRVQFPVLNSKEPGKLDLTNAKIEDLLA